MDYIYCSKCIAILKHKQKRPRIIEALNVVAGAGFEPTTFGL
ncbi:hypothetical protein GLIP_0456 [Aliiglaciecola lipolytica E3]|uniref:Uncharacterized protein n=1 Tax=Aliiglaciecola lipolytica E3 TaxID=1127673 RepID=K6Y4B3_9ALTE|nr:hypothetical protein GLIP_0456 [Aliiglaciecola lipolytica E3]